MNVLKAVELYKQLNVKYTLILYINFKKGKNQTHSQMLWFPNTFYTSITHEYSSDVTNPNDFLQLPASSLSS